jgi:hypothetical protein
MVLEDVRLAEVAADGVVEQLVVGDAAPEEEGKAGGKFEVRREGPPAARSGGRGSIRK